MSNFISTYSLDLSNIKIVDGDYTKTEDWEELICENEGRFSREGEFMAFEVDGLDLVISYELEVSGITEYDPGDYYTPPYSDFQITDETIYVTDVTLNDYDI